MVWLGWQRGRSNIRNEESMSCGRVETGRQGRRGRREQQGVDEVQGREVKQQGQGRVEISAEVGSVSRSGEIMAPSSYR